MISSFLGDVTQPGHGVFRHDTRFLSFYEATLCGKRLDKLNARNTTHYSSVFYLTNPTLNKSLGGHGKKRHSETTIDPRSVVVERRRFIENSVNEDFTMTNVSPDELDLKLAFELDADFHDLFTVKSQVYSAGFDRRSSTSSMEIKKWFDSSNNAFRFSCVDKNTGFDAETLVWFSERIRAGKGSSKQKWKSGEGHQEATLGIRLKPRESQTVTIVISPLIQEEKKAFQMQALRPEHFVEEKVKLAKAAEIWRMKVPKLRTNFEYLQHSYEQSVVDMLSLKMADPTRDHGWELLAAGCPWYMTLFGRDSLITSYQSLLFGGDLPKGTVEALSFYQGKEKNDTKDEEPGKIIHEMRYGDYALKTGLYPYFGTIDATPLFLILISEIYRWTLDTDFVDRHKGNILRALSWIDDYGDLDKDGFVEYAKKTDQGLDNQCWKDSWNSIQFSNGKIAVAPIATCEVQGYVYDAKKRVSQLAKTVWKDDSLSKKLSDEANLLKKHFNEKFWIDDKGYYALALDGEKKLVDGLASNNGQLLWSGIVADENVDPLVENLVGESLFSGYGIRTLSTKDRGFDPIGYHIGCVWAHDNSLIAKGLADYGKDVEAMQIISAMFDAASHFGYILPEAFAGFSKEDTGFPVRYPNACSPQGWAAGASFLFLRTMLGITPVMEQRTVSMDPIFLRQSSVYGGIRVSLEGIGAFGKKFNLRISESGKPEVEDVTSEGIITSAMSEESTKIATEILH